MKHYLFLMIFSISASISAKENFLKCKIFFANTNVVEGFATLPTNKSMENKIRYKAKLKSSNVVKIDGSKLDRIIYYIDDSPRVFYNTKFYKTMLDDKNKIRKKIFRPYWVLSAFMDDDLFVYWLSEDYRVSNKGKLVCYSDSNMALGDYETVILVKRPDEDIPTMFSFHSTGYITNGDKFFKRIAQAYFEKDKKILRRIKKNEFSLERYDELIRAYCKCNYQDPFYIRY